jgi:hypothetical protein
VRSLDDKWLLAYGLWPENLARFSEKNFTDSKKLADASLKIREEIQDKIGSTWCLLSLGLNATIQNELQTAKYHLSRCQHISEELDFLWLFSNATKSLGHVALLNNDTAEVQKCLNQSLKIAYDLGLERDVANHLDDFVRLRVAQNRLAEGVALISLLLQQPVSHQARSGGRLIRDREKMLLTELERRLSRKVYKMALERGEFFNLDDVVIELFSTKY